MFGRTKHIKILAAISAVMTVAMCHGASAREIKVLYVGALRSSLTELIPAFESSSAYTVKAEAGAAGNFVDRIQKGEAADVAIVTTVQIESLIAEGKIVPGTQVGIGRVGMGLITRAGGTKADIHSLDAFKQTLLAAKSIGHTDPASGASSAIYAATLLGRSDIAAQLKPKIKVFTSNALLFEAVAKGEVELGFGQMTEITAAPNVVLVGPLPAPIQKFSQFSAGIPMSAHEPDAGKAFISFLTSPNATAVMKVKGVSSGGTIGGTSPGKR
jgi:molybdate transport system substrate-binding protein